MVVHENEGVNPKTIGLGQSFKQFQKMPAIMVISEYPAALPTTPENMIPPIGNKFT